MVDYVCLLISLYRAGDALLEKYALRVDLAQLPGGAEFCPLDPVNFDSIKSFLPDFYSEHRIVDIETIDGVEICGGVKNEIF